MFNLETTFFGTEKAFDGFSVNKILNLGKCENPVILLIMLNIRFRCGF